MDQTLANFAQNNLELEEVIADAGYSSGESLQYCADKGIDAWIPNFGQYKPEREGFIFNSNKNQYECIQTGGNKAILPFKGIRTDSKGYQKKTYRSSESDCKHCPLREQCCGKVSKFKKLDESIHKPLYDKMHKKLREHKAYHRRLVKRRSSTVEPVLGTLINHHNMKRINSRGLAQANKHVLMAALCYNLKKYLKFSRKLPAFMRQILAIPKGMLFCLKRGFMDLKSGDMSSCNF
jgi:hypothetical protein